MLNSLPLRNILKNELRFPLDKLGIWVVEKNDNNWIKILKACLQSGTKNKRREDESFSIPEIERINVGQMIELKNHYFPNQSQLIQAKFIIGC